ncbi:MAG: PAS domain S-box protein [Gemmatimonadetes bacterium]|nr:PAS domain S-box protein [Gemmatimonadota bacterium]
MSAPAVAAQQDMSTFDSWRVTRFGDETLPSGIITSITAAASGRIWVSTSRGIAWFDGWRFVQGRTTPNTLNRAANAILPMTGDSVVVLMNRIMYVGDTAGFVQRPVIVNGTEEQVLSAVHTRDGLLLVVPYAATSDSVHLMRWTPSGAVHVDAPAPLGSRTVVSLHPAPDGGAWLNTGFALFRLRDGRWESHLDGRGRVLRVEHLIETTAGEVVANILGAEGGNGVWRWTGRGRPRRETGEGEDALLDLTLDAQGHPLAVHGGGYIRRRVTSWTPYARRPADVDDARTVHEDDVGDVWIGTGEGLLLLRALAPLWSGQPQGFPSRRDRVNALARARDGALWAGTGDGIDIFEPTGAIRHIGEAAGVPLGAVTTLARDSSGNMWVGSGASIEGALRWNGRTWQHFTARDGLRAPRVHRIVVSRSGTVWFLGIGLPDGAPDDGPGAFKFQDGRFTAFGVDSGLPSGRVYDFAEASDATRWFGTIRGLSRLRAGTWTHWSTRRGRTATRAFRDTPFRVFSLDVDTAGVPWFGDSQGDFPYGLGTVEADTLRFIGINDGLVSNAVQSVRAGDDGTVWIGTTNGLSAMNAGVLYRFGTDGGLGFPHIWPILPESRVVTVGTLGGGIRRLALDATDVPAPRVVIQPPTIGTSAANVAWTPLAWRGTIPSERIETRHRIDGKAWSGWSAIHSAVLSLPGGRHTLEVQAKGLFARTDGPITAVEFDVPGPIVTRPAFLIPVGALLLLLIALSVASARRQRRDAAVLRESEGRFRALAGATTEGIAISVGDRIVEANEQLHRMLGLPDGSLRGRAVPTVLGPAAAPAADDAARATTLQRADGERFPAEVRERVAPYLGAEARIAAVQDLSERVAARRALRESEERFETIFRKSPTAIVLTTWPEGRFVDVSEGFELASGYSRDELVGRSATELDLYHHTDDRDRLRAALERDAKAGGAEVLMHRRDGTLRSLLGTFVRLELDGRPHVLGALTDITDRRTLEAQLLQSQKMEAVGRLAGGVAHDFNNLLTVILGHADLLRSAVHEPTALADIGDIHAAAQRAADLTRQLLTFARKQRISPRIVELGGLVQRTQRMLARLLGERIAIEARIEADLPQVMVDAGQIEQVIVNLAVNARDAMPQGGRLTIEATTVELDEAYARDHAHITAGQYALIAMSDTGMGIPDDVLPRIFEPFFTTKEVGEGTGLGLSICYGIVREAGGHIAVYSEVNKGTTVRIYLPARPQLEEDVAESAPPAIVGGTEVVLVVEDEALVRALVERTLRSLGYTVVSAGSLADALAAVDRMPIPPRVLVTDVVLPGAGGPEIARALRARLPEIAVLYISGYTERGSSSTTALDAPLLSKPFTAAELAAAIRRQLDDTASP